MNKQHRTQSYTSMMNDVEPYNFYYRLVIQNGGKISEDNPFKDDKDFLHSLLDHFEQQQKYDVCITLLNRLYGDKSRSDN